MKKILTEKPLICFALFAFLIALRDAFTQLFIIKSVDPLIIVFIFFLITTSVAYGHSRFISRDLPIEKLESEGFVAKITLGVVTCAAFLLTVYGIKFLGAPIFSLVEHCLIPVSTLLIAYKLLDEKISRFMTLGMIISLLSVAIFLYSSTRINLSEMDQRNWYLGVFFAILSSLLTSVSSAFQKKLVNLKYRADQILYIRFILPTILVGVLILAEDKSFPSLSVFFQISILGLFFFTCPLLLLLQGFVRASLGRFSVFNILVPAFTFVVGSFLLEGEIEKWMNPWIVTGIVGIILGYIIFEWEAIRNTLVKEVK